MAWHHHRYRIFLALFVFVANTASASIEASTPQCRTLLSLLDFQTRGLILKNKFTQGSVSYLYPFVLMPGGKHVVVAGGQSVDLVDIQTRERKNVYQVEKREIASVSTHEDGIVVRQWRRNLPDQNTVKDSTGSFLRMKGLKDFGELGLLRIPPTELPSLEFPSNQTFDWQREREAKHLFPHRILPFAAAVSGGLISVIGVDGEGGLTIIHESNDLQSISGRQYSSVAWHPRQARLYIADSDGSIEVVDFQPDSESPGHLLIRNREFLVPPPGRDTDLEKQHAEGMKDFTRSLKRKSEKDLEAYDGSDEFFQISASLENVGTDFQLFISKDGSHLYRLSNFIEPEKGFSTLEDFDLSSSTYSRKKLSIESLDRHGYSNFRHHALSSDGRKLALFTSEREYFIIDLKKGRILSRWMDPSLSVRIHSMAFSPDGKHLLISEDYDEEFGLSGRLLEWTIPNE